MPRTGRADQPFTFKRAAARGPGDPAIPSAGVNATRQLRRGRNASLIGLAVKKQLSRFDRYTELVTLKITGLLFLLLGYEYAEDASMSAV